MPERPNGIGLGEQARKLCFQKPIGLVPTGVRVLLPAYYYNNFLDEKSLNKNQKLLNQIQNICDSKNN